MKRYIFLDVETTGLSPHRGDRVIELGCVEVINGFITGRIFHSYFKTNVIINNDAFQIHGINNDFLKNKPFFYEKLDDFLGFIENSIIVAHNAKFDMNFIHYEINQCGGDADGFYQKNFFLDSLEIARKMFPKQKNDLNSLSKRLKIIKNKNYKHSAIFDSWLLSVATIKMGFFEKNEHN